jgi:hypothetical protein
MKSLCLILIALMLAGCATPLTHQYATNAEYMAANGLVATDVPTPPMPVAPIPPPVPPPPPAAEPGPSTAQVIGTILLLPILIPVYVAVVGVAVLASGYSRSGGYGGSVTCKGKVYADGTKWRSSCS